MMPFHISLSVAACMMILPPAIHRFICVARSFIRHTILTKKSIILFTLGYFVYSSDCTATFVQLISQQLEGVYQCKIVWRWVSSLFSNSLQCHICCLPAPQDQTRKSLHLQFANMQFSIEKVPEIEGGVDRAGICCGSSL